MAATTWGEGLLAYTRARAGQRQDARRLLNSLLARRKGSQVSSLAIATAYAGLGQREEAMLWLRRAFEDREFRIVYLNVDPAYAGLLSDPRLEELTDKLGLPRPASPATL